MVRNLVFDMGNVLVFYDSRRASRRFAQDEAEMEAVNTSVFVSPEWLMLDMGVISQEEALRRMQARLPEGHAREVPGCAWSTGTSTVCGRCRGWRSWWEI